MKISYFHATEALTPISCIIDLKLISESALYLKICRLPYSSTVVIYVSSLILLLAQKSVLLVLNRQSELCKFKNLAYFPFLCTVDSIS